MEMRNATAYEPQALKIRIAIEECEGPAPASSAFFPRTPATRKRRTETTRVCGRGPMAHTMFGPDRVVFGTDCGPLPIDPKARVAIADDPDICDEDKQSIFWKNANEFFRLELTK